MIRLLRRWWWLILLWEVVMFFYTVLCNWLLNLSPPYVPLWVVGIVVCIGCVPVAAASIVDADKRASGAER